MVADMESNKILTPIAINLFLRGTKLNISFVSISQSIRQIIRLNATHYFIMKIPNRRELQQSASNHSSDIYFENFMKLYEDYTA